MLASWKDLCIDAVDVPAAARFWGAALGLTVTEEHLTGETKAHTVWLNAVPEPKTAKNRVHLDVHTDAIESLTALGAEVVEPAGRFRWTLLTDPDGQEFCAFVRDAPPAYRLYELVVDCADPQPLARWWADVLGAPVRDADDGEWALSAVPGAPWEYLVFQPVPEPKTVKNRVHWDVDTPDLSRLLDAGATLLRPEGGDIGWNVLADPAGNEFCAFTH